jgi:MFS family permease
MISDAATAALSELVPGHDARRAALLATLAQSDGSAGVPLLAGMLAQWAFASRTLPFLVGMALCATMIVALRIVPESAQGGEGGCGSSAPGSRAKSAPTSREWA